MEKAHEIIIAGFGGQGILRRARHSFDGSDPRLLSNDRK